MAPCLYKQGQRVEGVGPWGECRTLEGRAHDSLSTAPDARPWASFFTSLCPGSPTLPGGLGHIKGRYKCHDGCGIAPPWQRSQSCSWSCLPSAALRGDVCVGAVMVLGQGQLRRPSSPVSSRLAAGGSGGGWAQGPWVLVSYFPQLLPACLEPPTHQDSETQAGPASLSSASGGRWHAQGSWGSFPGHTHTPTSRLSPKAPL